MSQPHDILQEFQNILQGQYPNHTCGVGLSIIRYCDPKAVEQEKDSPCIAITLSDPMPPNINLPREYKNLKIFVLTDNIVPQGEGHE